MYRRIKKISSLKCERMRVSEIIFHTFWSLSLRHLYQCVKLKHLGGKTVDIPCGSESIPMMLLKLKSQPDQLNCSDISSSDVIHKVFHIIHTLTSNAHLIARTDSFRREILGSWWILFSIISFILIIKEKKIKMMMY